MIKVDRLCKVYGNRVAVWNVSFHLRKGEILGFLGPNGAGKTTTMRMITGFIPASSGQVTVAGRDVSRDPLRVKEMIGYLCEAPPVYREMSVTGYLRFVANLKKVPAGRVRAGVDRSLELCGLTDVSNRVIGNLSKGYRQRVGLAQAIVHEPPVLILDEPTVGLDPRQIKDIRFLIKELSGEQTVILSTHILPEVTVTCNRVVIINEGQIVAQDSVEGLTAGLGRGEQILVRVRRPEEALTRGISALDGVEGVESAGEGVLKVRTSGGEEVKERIAGLVVGNGAGLVELTRVAATLEEVFLKLVTEEEGEAA